MNARWILAVLILLFSPLLAVAERQGFLTNEEIDLFFKQGYLLKPKALKSAEVAKLSERVTRLVDRALKQIEAADVPLSDDDQFLHIDGSRIVFKKRADRSISVVRVNGCSGMEPVLMETVRSEKMVRTFFELLGTSDLEHLISQIHPKLPGDGIAYPRHHDIQFRKLFDPDWKDVLGNGSYAICIIPIDPMTPENGGLWIDRNNYPEPQGLEEDLVWIHSEPGDLLFMHPYLFHGSGPNLSQLDSRRTLLTGFCAFGANHKPYPGAHVNARLTLSKGGSIAVTPAPWSQTPCVGPATGH